MYCALLNHLTLFCFSDSAGLSWQGTVSAAAVVVVDSAVQLSPAAHRHSKGRQMVSLLRRAELSLVLLELAGIFASYDHFGSISCGYSGVDRSAKVNSGLRAVRLKKYLFSLTFLRTGGLRGQPGSAVQARQCFGRAGGSGLVARPVRAVSQAAGALGGRLPSAALGAVRSARWPEPDAHSRCGFPGMTFFFFFFVQRLTSF